MPTEHVYSLIQEWKELRRMILGISNPVEHIRAFQRMKNIQIELESLGIIRYVSDPEFEDGAYYTEQRI